MTSLGSSTYIFAMNIRAILATVGAAMGVVLTGGAAWAAPEHRAGGEANLVLPDLSSVSFLGIAGNRLLLGGIVVCVAGLLFGLVIYQQLRGLPVHKSMQEISELIYETCKT